MVQINAYYKTMKVFLTLHACRPVVGGLPKTKILTIIGALKCYDNF